MAGRIYPHRFGALYDLLVLRGLCPWVWRCPKMTELRDIHTGHIEGRQLDRPERKPLESLGALRRASEASGKIR